MARWRAPGCSAKARPISPSSAAISTCRRMRRPWRRCARTSRCCGCRRPPRSRARRPRPQITKIAQLAGRRIGVVGRTQANVNLLKVILQQYGVDPAKVEIVQFPANEAAEAIRNQKADAYLAAGPVNSKITADAIAASDARRRHAEIPRDRFGRGDCAEPSRLRGFRNSRRHIRRRAEPARGGGQDDQLLAPHRGAQGHCRNRRSPPSRGSCSRSARR